MEGNRVVKVDESTAFLEAAPHSQWPARGRILRRDTPTPDYHPATGRRDLGEGDAEQLRERLDQLADALVGGILFRSLHSILAVEAQGRKPTFALVLRHGSNGAAQVFEYDASACAFVPRTEADPRDAYLAGWECWATDLLAVLNAQMGPITLMFGRSRLWNALPGRLRFDLLEGFTRLSHPLTRPAAYLRNYQRLWKESKDVIPAFAAR
jgi:hypothetical protein